MVILFFALLKNLNFHIDGFVGGTGKLQVVGHQGDFLCTALPGQQKKAKDKDQVFTYIIHGSHYFISISFGLPK